MDQSFTLKFSQIRMSDIARVGGKNASLGELFAALKLKGVGVLDGFAVTTDAYWGLLEEQGLREKLEQIFSKLDPELFCVESRKLHLSCCCEEVSLCSSRIG
ncbi:MAG: hypothetical protein LAO78_11805 [Acidobacteriia bacterium]|nr:hypothetical protein [Terriglobia bacterium]